jgi:hypothetical protein
MYPKPRTEEHDFLIDPYIPTVILVLRSTNHYHQIQLATHCLPYIRLPKTPNLYTFALKMATVMFAETLDNSEHSTRLILES